MSPSARNLDHLTLFVRDLQRSKRFYMKALGMKFHRSWQGTVWLKAGKSDFFLNASRAKRLRISGINHFGFNVRSRRALQTWENHLAKSRVKIFERRMEDGGAVYFRDPDGYVIELYYEP